MNTHLIQFFTEDEDAKTKCANLYAPAYQELADFRTRKKIKELEVKKTEKEGYEEFSLPKCKQIRQIIGIDKYNNKTAIYYYTLGEKIFVSNKKDTKVKIEYLPFLTVITDETGDDFELEIDQDLQMILPYKIASDLFKTDPLRRLYSI